MNIEVGQTYPVGHLTYTVLDEEEHLVKVSAEPRPSWAAPCWIKRTQLVDLIEQNAACT